MNNKNLFLTLMIVAMVYGFVGSGCAVVHSTGDLGVVVAREQGEVVIVSSTQNRALAHVKGLGDLSHASVVYDKTQRYAYIFGRDGGLTKVDLARKKIAKRIIQAGNSIGGAISQDGQFIAVSNYEPGGVKIFRTDTLELVVDLLAASVGKTSRTVGLVDIPGNLFVCSLFDADEIWVIDPQQPQNPIVHRFEGIGLKPYDGLMTPDGRHYVAGLYGESGLVVLDLWDIEAGPKKVLHTYRSDDIVLPVYKMPHLEGWAMAQSSLYMPGVGHHEVIVVDTLKWSEQKRIQVAGQPIFVMSGPDQRYLWVNFALPDNNLFKYIARNSHCNQGALPQITKSKNWPCTA